MTAEPAVHRAFIRDNASAAKKIGPINILSIAGRQDGRIVHRRSDLQRLLSA